MLWIYGASGHGKVILDILELNGLSAGGFLDDDEKISEFMGLKVIRPHELTDLRAEIIIAIGDNATRKMLVEKNLFKYITAIHPSSIISSNAALGDGIAIMARSVIQPGCIIGNHAIINTGANIDHDCKIGDYAHISPGVTLCGNVTIGECTWVGAGTTVIEGVTIGKNVIVGAGSLIRKDVPDNVLVAGNPQRVVRVLKIND